MIPRVQRKGCDLWLRSVLKVSALIGFICLLCLNFLLGATMQCTFSGEGDGFWTGRQFSYTTVTITATFDTSEILDYGGGLFVLPVPQGAEISAIGVGTGRFEDQNVIFFSNHSQILGLTGIDPAGDETYITRMGITTPFSQPYDLSTPIGPLHGPNFIGGSTTATYATTDGDLVFYDWYPTFTVTAVPEPGIVFWAFGALVYSVMRVRKKITKRGTAGFACSLWY